jgi:cell division protease FtsH
MALGGRAAEELIFGKISTGALSDLERITKMAYSIVTMYGMNEKIGNVSFYDSKQSDYSFNKPYSDATAQTIDNEVRQIIQDAYNRTKELLTSKMKELEVVAQELLAKEILFQADLERLVGKRPFAGLTTLQAHMSGTDRSQTLSEVEQQIGGHVHDNGSQNGQSIESKNTASSDNSSEEKKPEPEREGAAPGQSYSFDS